MFTYENEKYNSSVLLDLVDISNIEDTLKFAISVANSKKLPLGLVFVVRADKHELTIIQRLKELELEISKHNVKFIVMYGSHHERMTTSLKAFQAKVLITQNPVNATGYMKIDIQTSDDNSAQTPLDWPGRIASVSDLEEKIGNYLTTGQATC